MSGLARAAASLLLAVVLAAAILLDFVPWVIEPEMLQYVLPHLLRPSTGFLSLVLVLFLAIWLPLGLPAARIAAARPDGSAAQGSRPDLPSEPEPPRHTPGTPEQGSQLDRQEQPARRPAPPEPDPAHAVEIPLRPVTLLDARQRLEMARALDVPWDGRLARDDEAWLRACAGGLQRAARRHR